MPLSALPTLQHLSPQPLVEPTPPKKEYLEKKKSVLPYILPYCRTTKNEQEFDFDSATHSSSFPLIIDVVEQGLTARFLTQTAIRTLESILHQKSTENFTFLTIFPLLPQAYLPRQNQRIPNPKRAIDSIKARQITQGKGNFTAKIILYFILATAARVPTSTQKSALLDVAYDKRRDCVARPLPYPSYFNISLPPLPRCSIPHELQLSAHPSFVNEPSPTVDYIFRLLALVRFVLATQLKPAPQPYRTACADIYIFQQSYRSTTCQIPHRKTILWFKRSAIRHIDSFQHIFVLFFSSPRNSHVHTEFSIHLQ